MTDRTESSSNQNLWYIGDGTSYQCYLQGQYPHSFHCTNYELLPAVVNQLQDGLNFLILNSIKKDSQEKPVNNYLEIDNEIKNLFLIQDKKIEDLNSKLDKVLQLQTDILKRI
ncbi:hypothetical protein RuFDV_gp1 [Rudbeckia flower distortion virus]|uniref:Uncharacterized protein n=1 Tax=Rudbeckia flower distortion virus TaxID=587370 RepID=B8Y867_9VIRU|nr:hypothetical protein RuFDV_gp1 [Rudbeckia flower distortion virus]ACL36978.1 hypothetical protein [Rudbeckia flower distortion virus]